jgi:hypothetical protein
MTRESGLRNDSSACTGWLAAPNMMRPPPERSAPRGPPPRTYALYFPLVHRWSGEIRCPLRMRSYRCWYASLGTQCEGSVSPQVFERNSKLFLRSGDEILTRRPRRPRPPMFRDWLHACEDSRDPACLWRVCQVACVGNESNSRTARLVAGAGSICAPIGHSWAAGMDRRERIPREGFGPPPCRLIRALPAPCRSAERIQTSALSHSYFSSSSRNRRRSRARTCRHADRPDIDDRTQRATTGGALQAKVRGSVEGRN